MHDPFDIILLKDKVGDNKEFSKAARMWIKGDSIHCCLTNYSAKTGNYLKCYKRTNAWHSVFSSGHYPRAMRTKDVFIGVLGTLISVFSTAQMSMNRGADLKSCLLKE